MGNFAFALFFWAAMSGVSRAQPGRSSPPPPASGNTCWQWSIATSGYKTQGPTFVCDSCPGTVSTPPMMMIMVTVLMLFTCDILSVITTAALPPAYALTLHALPMDMATQSSIATWTPTTQPLPFRAPPTALLPWWMLREGVPRTSHVTTELMVATPRTVMLETMQTTAWVV